MSIPNTSQYDTNCPVAPSITSTSITYPSGAWIPAEGCVINVTVTATSTGTNTIPASALQTDAGSPVNPASATLTIVPTLTPPGLSKSFMTSPVAPGGVTELRVTLTNSNSTPLVLTEDLTDLMPIGLTLASDPTVSATYALRYGTCDSNYVMASSGTGTAGAQLFYTAGGSIPASSSCYVAVKVVAALPSSGTSYTNEIPSGSLQTQGGDYTQAATAQLDIALPDMSVDISGLPISGSTGVAYTGSFTCTNIGDAPASAGTSCAISGLPAGVSAGSCTLTPGSTAWVAGNSVPVNGVVTCSVSGTPTTAGSVTVTATTGATNDADSSNNTDSESVTIVDPTILAPDMAVNIDHIPAVGTAGSSYSGTFTCTNVGNAVAASGTTCAISGLPTGVTPGACTLTNPGPSAWTAGDQVPVGGVVTCGVSGTPTVSGSVTVTATTGATGDTNLANNTVSKSVAVSGAPDMAVSISGIPNTATVGVVYNGTYTCTNVGNVSATAGTSCAITGLPAGVTQGNCTLTPGSTPWVANNTVPVNGVVTCSVSGTPTTAGSVTVTATTGATGDTNLANNTATKSVTVSAPDMAVSITGIPGTATVGVPYTGSYTCSNIGNANAASGTSCAITGPPAGVTVGVCTLTPGSSTWTAGNAVPAGSVVTCSVSGTPTTAGSVTVTATTGATGDSNVGNNTASKSVSVGQIADLSVLKNAPTLASPAGVLTYTVTISNAGASGANGATFTDNVPTGVTNFVWSCDLATGGAICPNATGAGAVNETILIFPAGSSLTYTLTGSAPATGSVLNTATLTAPAGVVDPDLTNNADTTSTALSQTPLPATADLSVTKYGPTSVNPSSTLTFQLVVANAGYAAADGAQLADAVPAGLTNVSWTCQGEIGGALCPNASGTDGINETIATFPAGSSLTYLVTGSVGTSGSITNTVSLTPPVGVSDPDPTNNTDSRISTIEPITAYADLSVSKVGPASATNGQNIAYRLLVSNSGASDVIGAQVLDLLPSGLTDVVWTCANAAGSTDAVCQTTSGTNDVDTLVDLPVSARVEILVTGKAPATGAAVFANVAEVIPPQGVADPRPDNNMSSAVITQLAVDALPADLSVLKNAPALVLPSGEVTYTVTISNAGASGANGAVFADNVPAGMTNFAWSCDLETGGAVCPNAAGTGALNQTIQVFPAGSSLTYTLTGMAPTAGSVANTATLTAPAGVVDPDLSNNTDTASTAISEAPLPATADLSVTKYGPTSVAPNGSLTFKLLIANGGYVAADGAQLADAVPTGLTNVTWTCQGEVGGAICPTANGNDSITETINTFPAGSTLTYLVTGTVGASGTITNQVNLTPPAGMVDPDPSNNSDSSLSTIQPITGIADLSVTKIGPASVANGQDVTYRLLVANAGSSDVAGARVVDRLPAELTTVQWTCAIAAGSAGGACQSASGTSAVNVLVDLPVSSRVEIVVTGRAPASGTAAFANVAEVFTPAGIEDPRPENNLSSAVITQLLIQPVANDDYYTTLVNTSVTGQLANNDTVPTGSTFAVVTGPANGSLSLDPVTGEFTYNPTTGWSGVDSFTYELCLPSPNQTVCDSAVVTISIPNVVAANNGATTTSGNPNLLNVLNNVTFQGEPLPAADALIQPVGTWPTGITINDQTGQVGVASGTTPGNYQVQVMVCKNMPAPSSLMARASSVGNLTQNGQCCLVTLDIVVTPTPPPPPNPIPTLGEWGQMLMMLMLLLSMGYYSRRAQRR
jgi:uncharacterized repeat protein (TIGR01451 family)